MSYSLLETDSRKMRYQIAYQTCQKPVPVFWYRFNWYRFRFISGKCVMGIKLNAADDGGDDGHHDEDVSIP